MQQSPALQFARYRPVIFMLAALYLVSCFSPLRIEYDSIRYFAIKDCLETGCATDSPAARDFLPHGYAVLLLGLSVSGILNSFSIAFINALYLLFSLLVTRKIMSLSNPILFYVVVLLNWTLLKLFAYPLSEMQYLFFSAASIYSYYQYTKTKSALLLITSFLLAALAVFTRSVGMALVFSLVLALLWEHRKLFGNKIYLLAGISAVALIIILFFIALAKFPGVKHYVNELLHRQSRMGSYIEHTEEWGQLLINMPTNKLKTYLPPGLADGIFIVAGLALIGWLIFVLVRRSKFIPAVVIIYLAIYSIVIFNWSYFDPRFWVPVLPFIAAIIVQTPLPKKPLLPIIFFAYLLMGIIAFGYSFYTQFNKKAFARIQANGIFRNEYETHFFGKPLSDTTAPVNPEVLSLLEKYDH